MLTLVAVAVFSVALIVAAAWDIVTQEIPNLSAVAVVVAFVIVAIAESLGLWAVVTHLLVGAAAFGVFGAFFWRGWMGGGDVKLIAACAIWFGASGVLPYLLMLAFIGGGFALLVLIARLAIPERVQLKPMWLKRLMLSREGVPYGVAIATAGLIALPYMPAAGLETLMKLI